MDKKISVDVTALIYLPRITGIQKVVRSCIGGQAPVRLLAFSPKHQHYVELVDLPQPQVRHESGPLEMMRELLLQVAQRLAQSRVLSMVLGVRGIEIARKFGQGAFRLFLSRHVYSINLQRAKPVEDGIVDFVWLLDIPKSAGHLNFLRKSIQESDFGLGAYLYDMIPYENPELLSPTAHSIIKREFAAYLEIVDRCQALVFLSNDTKTRYAKYRSETQSTPLPPNLVLYPPMRPQSIPLGEVEGRPQDLSRMILSVAPLTKRKNLGVVLDAFEELAKKSDKYSLTIVAPPLIGADPDIASRLRALQHRFEERIVVKHSVSEEVLIDLYQSARVVLVPSIAEGFGLPLIEAIQLGTRVICSEIPIFLELAEFLDITTAAPNDVKDWVDKIRALDGLGRSHQADWSFLPSQEEFLEGLSRLQEGLTK